MANSTHTRARAPLSPKCPLWVDTVEKVVSDPPKRNNRIRTARYLNRNCVRGRDFESMLRIQGRKIVFQQYRSKADICSAKRHVRFTPESDIDCVFRHVRFRPIADIAGTIRSSLFRCPFSTPHLSTSSRNYRSKGGQPCAHA